MVPYSSICSAVFFVYFHPVQIMKKFPFFVNIDYFHFSINIYLNKYIYWYIFVFKIFKEFIRWNLIRTNGNQKWSPILWKYFRNKADFFSIVCCKIKRLLDRLKFQPSILDGLHHFRKVQFIVVNGIYIFYVLLNFVFI